MASQDRALELRPDDSVREVTILKFNDYQCPPCQRAWAEHRAMLDEIAREHQEMVTFRSVDLPFETECNAFVSLDRHDASCEAAAAMRMAVSTGTAAQLERWLWENQPSLTREHVAGAAESIGRVQGFWQKYEDTLELVRQDVELAHRLGAPGTPTYYLNGIRLPTGVASADFKRAIEAEVQRVRTVTHAGRED
jgi:protein-disulfide isomerase